MNLEIDPHKYAAFNLELKWQNDQQIFVIHMERKVKLNSSVHFIETKFFTQNISINYVLDGLKLKITYTKLYSVWGNI